MFKVPLQRKDPSRIFSKSMEFPPGLGFLSRCNMSKTVEKTYRKVALGGNFFPDANE